MTHARKKASLGQYHGEGRDHVEGWSHGKTVGEAWPGRSLQEGRAKNDMVKKVKSKNPEHWAVCRQNDSRSQRWAKHSLKMSGTKKDVIKTVNERKRKLYPLRGRGGVADREAMSCHVLLTRLDDQRKETGMCEVDHKRAQGHKKIPKSKKKRSKKPTDAPPEPRKRRLASLNAEAVNSLLLEKTNAPPGPKLVKKQGDSAASEQTKPCTNSRRASKSDMCQSPKPTKKAKWEGDEASLYAPTPRRLAGLNAAALLKLTSSTAHEHRSRADGRSVCPGKQGKPKVQKSSQHRWHEPDLRGACQVCKSVQSRLTFKGSPDSRRLTKPGYRSMLGYPIRVVKEEQVEAELSPFYCCPPEGSLQYCHQLALLLGQKAYGESDEHTLASVKHECLVPAHPTLTLSAHPCLCADPCYCGYYVHIAHPGPAAASLSAQTLPCTHRSFCPRGLSGSKLLASSGIPHPVCCHEACPVSRYTFQPVTSRTCSFSTNCSHCSRPIQTEGFSSSPKDRSRSLLVPPALPLSVCTSIPRVNPSPPLVPRLLSTMSDHRQAEVRLKVGKECPQNTKPSNGSLTMGHTRSSQKQPTTSSASAKHRRKASRRQATNGWRPVGAPSEREVFIAGDDETVLRQCYEGVEREGEVIRVRDTVLLRSGPRKKSLPYVAKISALWEEPRTGELMMSLFWYYRPEHTQGGRDPNMHCENEIFASRHQDENSVACIEDRCYVLPLAQYCRFCALVKRRSEGVSERPPLVPGPSDSAVPPHRLVPDGVDPQLVYLCRHVYDFRYGRILKNLQ